jgi:hypothetical protein
MRSDVSSRGLKALPDEVIYWTEAHIPETLNSKHGIRKWHRWSRGPARPAAGAANPFLDRVSHHTGHPCQTSRDLPRHHHREARCCRPAGPHVFSSVGSPRLVFMTISGRKMLKSLLATRLRELLNSSSRGAPTWSRVCGIYRALSLLPHPLETLIIWQA